ncbi:hypothetical protein DTL42_19360 [Bremerella cremea]|uniref:Uncharacterized protein n=1 Tax=Bremerella cremea TaxID=1031537 RepID=A0A368KPD2_9BACT|nr:hypothetical protein DTL42_19360 [Bremerella cremea]
MAEEAQHDATIGNVWVVAKHSCCLRMGQEVLVHWDLLRGERRGERHHRLPLALTTAIFRPAAALIKFPTLRIAGVAPSVTGARL